MIYVREEDELVHCTFDIDQGLYRLKIQKFIPGEKFTDLDMLTKLLRNEKPKEKNNLIEVIESDGETEDEENIETWEIDQGTRF